jgi:hypothetical protein
MNKIKTKWSEVTIGQYQELTSIQTDNEVSLFIERLSILTDRDPAEIRALGLREFQNFQKQLAFLSQEVGSEVVLKFELDGVKYGMIPDLNFITAGEWIDAENWKSEPIDNLHLYAALIFRPIVKEVGDDYYIEEHKSHGFVKRSELFREKLSIEIVNGAVLFFSSFVIGLMPILADYLQTDMKKMGQMIMKMTQIQQATKSQD